MVTFKVTHSGWPWSFKAYGVWLLSSVKLTSQPHAHSKWNEDILRGGTDHVNCIGQWHSSCSCVTVAPTWSIGHPFDFSFLILVDRTPCKGDQPLARPLPDTENKRKQTPMPWVGFEPTISVFQRAKTFRALDRTATVIGSPQFIFMAWLFN
jgi:hypothetical protein